ncbi:integral membrane protein [Aspergillus uvarum CBS 121591]|uniref:Integral membrane protein n=1 Tax=Aspergillus uvarum CBS 121591 TaxID=1448315 RepID=A0A319C772_9EURO|nr:integral membrane protein [Aspergillus uvarum CBS 121591]PYH79679.1 integral membrane protein [Aspergillus uvarum CBS 121591]
MDVMETSLPLPPAATPADQPPVLNYILSFLLVGVAWGFTTPFIRRAAADFNARQEARTGVSQDEHDPTATQPPTTYNNNNAPESDNETVPLNPMLPSDERNHPSPDNNDNDSASETDLPPPPPSQQPVWMRQQSQKSWLRTKIVVVLGTVVNLLRTPAYSVPLVVNLTGSIWFFLLVGKHELSLTVPLANSSAFLFTVLGEWYVERKVIARETWVGMALVLAGIAICVVSKS